ncbi:MAG: serine hydrolase domain-containing protein [Crocinitomicaceae bacterium]
MFRGLFISAVLLCVVGCQPKPKKIEGVLDAEASNQIIVISKTENYSKQIILKCGKTDLEAVDSLVNWVVDFEPGGLFFNSWPIEKIQELAIRLDTILESKPLFFIDYFPTIKLKPYPIWSANRDFQDSVFWHGFLAAGINVISFPESVFKYNSSNAYFQKVNKDQGFSLNYHVNLQNRSLKSLQELAKTLQKNDGFLWLDSLKLDSLPYLEIKKAINWKGLLIANPLGNHLDHLKAGADMVLIPNRSLVNIVDYQQSDATIKSSELIANMIDEQVNSRFYNRSSKALLKAAKLHFIAKSTSIFNKTKQKIPFQKYKKLSLIKYLSQKKHSKKQLVTIPFNATDSILLAVEKSSGLENSLFLFSNSDQYKSLSKTPYLVFNPLAANERSLVLGEQLLGKLKINGGIIIEGELKKGPKAKGKGLQNLPPEYAFIDSEKLNSIRGLISSAIDGKAFPGCQILAIKDDVIIYSRAFGHSTYQKEFTVTKQHLYDLASLTKALATTLVAMKLWEDGYFKLNDKLDSYLPDSLKKYLPNGSTLKNITFQELLTHKSGLPAGFPVINYMRKAADLENRFSSGFCDYPYEAYQTKVANDLYLENSFQDSMWLTLNSLWLDSSKEYKYSDVNMNVLYFILKSIIDKKGLSSKMRLTSNVFERYLYENFYKPLGMNKTQYLPLKKISKNKIVPTENDRFWRKQLLHGYVHDPNAALYGGVAGNAGLFSNASDLGILLSMWQNNGVFEGKRYLKATTVKKFTEAQPNTHRGLGFNKRTFTNSAYAMAEDADPSSYGHTGFTGTCFWVDPVNRISYVFLSNRVHPNVSRKIYEFNIRTRVHQVFYEATLK